MTLRLWMLAVAMLIALPSPFDAAVAQAATPVRHRLTAGGVGRSYLLYLPPDRAGRPLPLVLVLHGGGGRARGIAEHTGFTTLAEREGFAVVYPEGIGGHWNDGRGWGSSRDDVGFIRALLDTVSRQATIDPKRIYATGISNGAMFAYRLACDLPGAFAAIAPVAGAVPAALAEHCAGSRPVAVEVFQGTADPLMPYHGGGVALRRGQVLSAQAGAELWARVDGCGPPADVAPRDSISDGTRLLRRAWSGCREEREVVLYSVEGGGHTWPGGPAVGRRVGRVTREIAATPEIWSFFAAHPRP